ncbi:hypothetical protein HHI36_013649, partial [Cryptolaemus montrouzieri]
GGTTQVNMCTCYELKKYFNTYLAKISFSSCSDTNWPKLATKSVEQGGLLTPIPGWDDEDPTGEAKAGLGRKCGNEACIEVNAVGCGRDIDV